MKGYFDEHSVMDNERWERRRDPFSVFLALAMCLCSLLCAWVVIFGPPQASGPCGRGAFVTRDIHGALHCVNGHPLKP